jgi:hypothetical protein
MAATFRGFFGRAQWHRALGCAAFEFDANDSDGDIVVGDGRNDPGLYHGGHEFLRPYQRGYERALVVLDCEWDGSPGKQAIERDLERKLVGSGWNADAVRVIAIEPELENWLWQDKPQVAAALGYDGEPGLRALLEQRGWWPSGAAKPPRPKEAVEWVLQQTRLPRSSSLYQALAYRISSKGCTDAAFLAMRAQFQAWFPVEAAA